mmetsp:Transcript_8219/g.13353  ORF Transcript_8219/g.13353 Transcript_8219/m.13353 type:complete len:343 (-) Transcript_8219:2317-3345(-)
MVSPWRADETMALADTATTAELNHRVPLGADKTTDALEFTDTFPLVTRSKREDIMERPLSHPPLIQGESTTSDPLGADTTTKDIFEPIRTSPGAEKSKRDAASMRPSARPPLTRGESRTMEPLGAESDKSPRRELTCTFLVPLRYKPPLPLLLIKSPASPTPCTHAESITRDPLGAESTTFSLECNRTSPGEPPFATRLISYASRERPCGSIETMFLDSSREPLTPTSPLNEPLPITFIFPSTLMLEAAMVMMLPGAACRCRSEPLALRMSLPLTSIKSRKTEALEEGRKAMGPSASMANPPGALATNLEANSTTTGVSTSSDPLGADNPITASEYMWTSST